jgi:hypothetical protein
MYWYRLQIKWDYKKIPGIRHATVSIILKLAKIANKNKNSKTKITELTFSHHCGSFIRRVMGCSINMRKWMLL